MHIGFNMDFGRDRSKPKTRQQQQQITKEELSESYAVALGTKRDAVPLRAATNYFLYGAFEHLGDPIFKPFTSYSQWVAPKYSYAEMLIAYEQMAEIRQGIDFAVSVTVGAGHHFSAKTDRVVKHLEQFSDDINLDFIATQSAYETLAYGDSLWRYKDIGLVRKGYDWLEQLPLTALRRIWWTGLDENAMIGYYEFQGYKIQRLAPAELVHFRGRVTNASPFGLGLIAPLIVTKRYISDRNGTKEARYRMPIVDIINSMEDSVHKIMKRYIRRNVFVAPDASPAQIGNLQTRIETLEDEQDMASSGMLDVKELGLQTGTIDLEAFERFYQNPVIKALGTPTSRLYERGSLTEASANAAKTVTVMNLVAFQRQHARTIERAILKFWYMHNPAKDAIGVAIPWEEAKVHLEWGVAEKPPLEVDQFANLVRAAPTAFLPEEIRQFASDRGVTLNPDAWQAKAKMALLMPQPGLPNKMDMNQKLNKQLNGKEDKMDAEAYAIIREATQVLKEINSYGK